MKIKFGKSELEFPGTDMKELKASNDAMEDIPILLNIMHFNQTPLFGTKSDTYRLSCDIRFQPQNEAFDDRWAGKIPRGHGDSISKPLKSMEEARAGWGL